MASLAEMTDFENVNVGWRHEIKSFFLCMLRRIGFKNLINDMLNNIVEIRKLLLNEKRIR